MVWNCQNKKSNTYDITFNYQLPLDYAVYKLKAFIDLENKKSSELEAKI
jgi:hypothetical protein